MNGYFLLVGRRLSSTQFSCGMWPPSSLTQCLNWQNITLVKPRPGVGEWSIHTPKTKCIFSFCISKVKYLWLQKAFFYLDHSWCPLCESSVHPVPAQGVPPWLECAFTTWRKEQQGFQGSQTAHTWVTSIVWLWTGQLVFPVLPFPNIHSGDVGTGFVIVL